MFLDIVRNRAEQTGGEQITWDGQEGKGWERGQGKKREQELEFIISLSRDELQPSEHREIPKGMPRSDHKSDGNSFACARGNKGS